MKEIIFSYLNSYTIVPLSLGAVCVYSYFKRSQIPGPLCLPLVGYLPFLGSDPHKTFAELSKRYGGVFRIKLGMVDIVVLNDLQSIKEALSKDEFAGRPQDNVSSIYTKELSIGTLEGDEWREQRRFAMRTLRDLGFATSAMEDNVHQSVDDLCEFIDKNNGEPKNFFIRIHATTLNVLFAFIGGKRFEYENEKFSNLLHTAVGGSTPLTDVAVFYPTLGQLFARFEIFGFDKFRKIVDTIMEYAEESVKEHENRIENNDIRKCYISEFLSEMNELEKLGKKSSFNRYRLVVTIFDVFFGSFDTTGSLIAWILLVVTYFPEVQKKIQNEIATVIGSRTPQLSDKNAMVYTQAVILEVQRWISFVPINFPRRTVKEVSLNGIRIPKGTQVLANFYAVHVDPKIWEKPNEFIPERFIGEDGKQIVNNEAVLTFSMGKRDCGGKQMANAMLFLYTTKLLQKYDISTVDEKKPSLDYTVNVSLQPKSVNLKFKSRK